MTIALLRRLRTPIPLEGERASIAALPPWLVTLTLAPRPEQTPEETATWWIAELSEAGRAYLDVLDEVEELRLTLAAELHRPEGGADLGFTLEPEGWVCSLGTPDEFGETNEAIVIEDYRDIPHPTGRPYRRAHYLDREEIAVSYHETARAAMKAEESKPVK